MKKLIFILTGFFVLASAGCFAAKALWHADVAGTLAITFLTAAYHFVMRLCVAFAVNAAMHNRADYKSRRYSCTKTERKLYKRLKVRRWAAKVPAYDPSLFDRTKHTWEEIAGAMCQAETVHGIIVILSFVPVLFYFFFGALPVFIITSATAAAFDLVFVIIQRYNLPRVIRLIEREKKGQSPEY